MGAARKMRSGARKRPQRTRRKRRDREQQAEEREEACGKAARGAEHDRKRSGGKKSAGDEKPTRCRRRARLENGALQPELRARAGRLDRGHRGRDQGNGDTRRERRHALDGHHEVEIVDCAGNEPHQGVADENSEQHPDERAGHANDACLAQQDDKHAARRCAERTQHTDERAALHDGKAHRAVDEKEAHEECQQTHHLQIGGERCGQIEILPRAAADRAHFVARGQALPQPRERSIAGGTGGGAQIDAREPSEHLQPLLRLRDVG